LTPLHLSGWRQNGYCLNLEREQRMQSRAIEAMLRTLVPMPLKTHTKIIVGGLILTDTGFVDWVKEQLLSFRDEEDEIPQLKKVKRRRSLETIVRVVCDEMRCSEEKIFEKGRNKNIGREMAIFLARDFSGVSCKALGKYFGGISGPAITLSYNHFAGKLASDKRLMGKIDKMNK